MSVPSPLLDTDDVKNFVPAKPALVQKSHKESYLALSPLRPELNQCGRNILITGASAGIGFAIARAYAEASSSRIIMTGRRKDVLQHAASVLSSDFPKTEFIVWVCDVGSVTDSAALWTGLRNDGIFIDVLVLNAAKFHDQKSILETELGTTWSLYETNVRTILDFSQRLQVQEESADRQKFIVYVSTAAIHDWNLASTMPTYSLSKTTGHLLLQRIANEVDREKLQIVSFHPGQILSEAARSAGLEKNSLPFDDENLPGHWAVWAATSEAAFLHGRFAWSAWDVEEMKSGEVKERIEAEPSFLSLSFVGL